MKKIDKNLRLTAALALLTALSILLGKYLAIRGGDVMRFSLENMPIIFAGMVFGPIAGGAVGLVADLLGCVMVGYTVNPVITIGGVAIGVISGLYYYINSKLPFTTPITVAITVGIAHLIGSVIIKTFGLAVYYDMPLIELMLWRLVNYTIVGVLDGVVVYALLNNKGVKMQIQNMGGKLP